MTMPRWVPTGLGVVAGLLMLSGLTMVFAGSGDEGHTDYRPIVSTVLLGVAALAAAMLIRGLKGSADGATDGTS